MTLLIMLVSVLILALTFVAGAKYGRRLEQEAQREEALLRRSAVSTEQKAKAEFKRL